MTPTPIKDRALSRYDTFCLFMAAALGSLTVLGSLHLNAGVLLLQLLLWLGFVTLGIGTDDPWILNGAGKRRWHRAATYLTAAALTWGIARLAHF